MAPYTLEESYEVVDAIERGDLADLREELGDLLLQVVFHARMAEEENRFDFGDVVASISEKMIRRHPHVFGDPAEPRWEAASWARIKAEEAAAKRERLGPLAAARPASVLDSVARALPALPRAQKLASRAAEVGFEWVEITEVLAKLDEEVAEVEEAVAAGDRSAQAEEIGDVLFTVANLARRLGVDAEAALRSANAKFERRFRFIERALAAEGRSAEAAGLAEMEVLWRTAKTEEPGSMDVQDSRRAPE